MDGQEIGQEEPKEPIVGPEEVWGRLDQATRDRVIELFAYMAYHFVSASGVQLAKEE